MLRVREQSYKLKERDIEMLVKKTKRDAIAFTVQAFNKVMREDFGFGDKRLYKIEEGIYKVLASEV